MGSLNILLIEDDRDDIELLQEALVSNGVEFKLHAIMQGDKILPWLLSTEPLPDVIVMDLNMPKLHGREILEMIKREERLCGIPLVVLSTSSSRAEKAYCLSRGATHFITKPNDMEGFKEAVKIITASAESIR